MRIEFAQSALDDLAGIKTYYLERDAEQVGLNFINAIFEKSEALTIHSRLGRIVPEFETDSLREIIYPPFRIVYQLDTDRIFVIRVWRNERLLKLLINE